MKNFKDFFSLNEDLNNELKDKLSSDYKSLKKGVLELIEDTIEEPEKFSNLKKFFDDFLEDDDNELELDGFMEQNDIYEFYLKHQSDVDSILADNEYYDKSLTELSIFSLYDYVVESTKESVKLTIRELNDELGETI